jgi:hypothetical protein
MRGNLHEERRTTELKVILRLDAFRKAIVKKFLSFRKDTCKSTKLAASDVKVTQKMLFRTGSACQIRFF